MTEIEYYINDEVYKTDDYTKVPFNILNRLDGPAIIEKNDKKDNLKAWFINGKFNRLDGPAIICSDGTLYWYINDKKLNTEEVESWVKDNNLDLKTKQHQALFMLRFS